ncbi:hypothetical protein OXX69_000465 [Metschnikowia pulcherrima]
MTSPNIDSDTERTVKIQPIDKFESMARLDQFEVIKKIGQGTFGVVQKARDKKSGNLVALKQLINHSAKEGFPITAMREITILKRLNHKNVLKIEGMIHEEPKTATPQDIVTQRGVFYTVSPYMSSDLVGLLENTATELDVPTIKCILQQLLEGINYIHQQHYLHRDIKAANILLDPNGVVKIADFGLARVYHGQLPSRGKGPGGGERNYTALVVTRWYRPPELLLGERKYTTAVDMWGVGCVFGELFTKKPILVGSSDSKQAQIIFDLVGPPNRENWPTASLLPNKPDLNIGLTCKRTLETRFQPLLGDTGADLLSKLLTLDPKRRYNALDALDHAYFTTDPKPILPEQIRRFEESHEIDKERFKRLRTSTWSTEHVPKRPRAEQERNDRSVASIRDGIGMKPPTGPSAMKPDYF